MKEKILLQRVQSHADKDAFVELYNIHVSPLYRFVYLKLSNKEEAEDVVSDSFMKAWQYMVERKGEKVRNFKALLYKIARNKIIDTYRDRAKRKDVSLEDREAQLISDGNDLAATVSNKSDAAALLATIQQLKQEYQEVVFLRHVEEMSIAEIATITQKGQAAVRVTLHRAMKKLKGLADYE